jgi:hypothetical protein
LGHVLDPTTVIQDGTHPASGPQGTGFVDVGGTQLTANLEYVQTLYRILLGRTGSVAEISSWENLVATQGTLAVANGILHAPGHEAFKHLVDGLYEELLGRAADPGGETFWSASLAGGATEEQVITAILTSAEFAARAGTPPLSTSTDPNTIFVGALYTVLLGRPGSPGEVSGWGNALPALGRDGVVRGILASAEFRAGVVRRFYLSPPAPPLAFFASVPDLLSRGADPGAAEVSGWVNSKLDLLSIEVGILASQEFFRGG